MKKLNLTISVLGSLGALVACSHAEDNRIQRAEIWQPQIEMPTSVVVCRSRQCAPAKLSMSKEYIYNSLMHLLDSNTQNKALICMADPASRICTENYLRLPITVGVTPANMYVDAVKIDDISATLGNKSLNLIMNYDVTYNGQTPTCKPARTLVYVKNASNIIMEDAGYSCKMTTIGNTTIKTLFAIDYIDLDYGYIGGYYSVGLSGPAYGGGSGYMLLRLPHDAYPLSPNLMYEEPKPAEPEVVEPEVSEPEVVAPVEPAPTVEEKPAESEVVAPTPTAPEAEVLESIEDQGVRDQSSCVYKRNCSPAVDKKVMIKAESLPNEEPKSVSAKVSSNRGFYSGVEIFPLPPKKKATIVMPEVQAQPGEKLSDAVEKAVELPENASMTVTPTSVEVKQLNPKAEKAVEVEKAKTATTAMTDKKTSNEAEKKATEKTNK